MSHFFSALSFLTIIPSPAPASWKGGRMVLYYPLVGLLIGGLLCGADYLFEFFFREEIRAVLDVLFLAIITGALHLDGLADTADGLLSHRPKERVLEIMRDQRIGIMGALALIFCVLLKAGGILSLTNSNRWVWLLAAPAFGRVAQVLGLVFLDYARNGGGIATNLFQKKKYGLLSFCPLAMGVPFLAGFEAGLLTLFLFVSSTIFILLFFQKKIDGMTGDTLGALSEITETTILLMGAILCENKLIFF